MSYNINTINYYRVNNNNTAIAQSARGNSGSPTEEISAPVFGGTFSSYTPNTLTITGQSGSTFNDLDVGQYLFYTTNQGVYVQVGQIATIAQNGLSLTLTDAMIPGSIPVSSDLYGTFSLITTIEEIFIRLSTDLTGAGPSQAYIPNFGLGRWRQSNGLTGRNSPAQCAIQRISLVGNPIATESPAVDIPFTFVTMNQFTVANPSTTGGGPRYFGSSGDFPVYIWIRCTPTSTIVGQPGLTASTLYTFITQQLTPSLTIAVQTTATQLSAAGYNLTGVNVSGPGTGSN